jgi:hypothetical protein
MIVNAIAKVKDRPGNVPELLCSVYHDSWYIEVKRLLYDVFVKVLNAFG